MNPAPIPYADPPAVLGIILDRRSDGLTITIPPPPRLYAVVYAASLLAVTLPFLLVGGVPPLSEVIALFRPIIFDLTPDTLRITNVVTVRHDGARRIVTLPRAKIYEVKYVTHSGNLFIRTHNHGIVDIRPVRDPRILTWIAEHLRQALSLPDPT